MKKYEFYFDPQIPTVSPRVEIMEFENDTTEEEIKEEFTEWVFNFLDTGYRKLDD